MNLGKSIIRLSIIGALLSLAPCIYADPILITSGSIQYSRAGFGTFILAGSGFNTTGVTPPLNPSVSLLANGFISPGGAGSTGGSVDTQDGDLFTSNPITVGGMVFTPANTLLQLGFTSASFNAPIGTVPGFIVTAPFSVNLGLIEGYPGILGAGVPLFSEGLSGSGVTTLVFTLTVGGQYQLQNQTFVFGQTVSGLTVQAVPEPASMLLLGASLAGLLGIRRKRSTNGNDRH